MPNTKSSSWRWILITAFAAVVIGLTACSMPTGGPAPGPAPTTTPAPPCDPDAMEAVTHIAPADHAILSDTTPTLTWEYNYPPSCAPESFTVTLFQGPSYTPSEGVSITVPGTQSSVVWPEPLESGTGYIWIVIPSNSHAGDTATYFFIGPMCTDAATPVAPAAPVLISPTNGSGYDYARDNFVWDYPYACLPTAYRIDIALDPEFSDIVASSGHSAGVHPDTRWAPGDPLDYCQTYYWRVKAYFSTVESPWSEVWQFSTGGPDRRSCGGEENMPISANLYGYIWHDVCGGEPSDPPPEGCVLEPDGTMHADGILQRDEPKLDGVRVDLHQGECDGPVVDSMVSRSAGEYWFNAFPAEGEYCVSISANVPPNDAILLPGKWTAPEGFLDTYTASQTVTIHAGDHVSIDFGWDYDLLPIPPMGGNNPQITPSPVPHSFHTTQNAFCRKGPSKVFEAVATLTEGSEAVAEGRLADNSWLYVYWEPGNVYCWIATYLGEIDDVDDLPVRTPPPTPTPVPDTTPPAISDLHSLNSKVFYGSSSCGPTIMYATARVTDEGGISDSNVLLVYRFISSNSGGTGDWHTTPVADVAMGGQMGFNVNVNTNEVMSLFKQLNGQIEFYVKAIDNAGNEATSGIQSIPLEFCQ